MRILHVQPIGASVRSDSHVDKTFVHSGLKSNVDLPSQLSLDVAHQIYTQGLLYWRISLRSFTVLAPMLLFLWIYFLPSMILYGKQGSLLLHLLYYPLRSFLNQAFYHAFIIVVSVELFGIRLCSRGMVLVEFPGFLLSIYVEVVEKMPELGTIISGLWVIGYIYTLRQKIQNHQDLREVEYHSRRDSLAAPLGKIVSVLVISFLAIDAILPIFIQAGLYTKILLRFGALPLISSLCSGLQIRLLKGVPNEHKELVIPILWVSNGIMKMSERLYNNNLVQNDQYWHLVLLSSLSCFVEIFLSATYITRNVLIQQGFTILSDTARRIRSHENVVSVVPSIDDAQPVGPSLKANDVDKSFLEYVRHHIVVEDISMELKMITSMTFLMYFVRSLDASMVFETIPNLNVCLIQVIIQLSIEIISDLFALYWLAAKDGIRLLPQEISIVDKWTVHHFVFLGWQIFRLFERMMSLAES
eukprot:TRINITY_DN18821_c0_g1_i1.p1 TRINITY_DN18821_c0_g1~~TRINITY_DN18821_c0_g1_i1.p1  ORF type:complete len:472 (-),score=50.84 TRINITY_DN18821_c0_g1_i1:114-1529(-)